MKPKFHMTFRLVCLPQIPTKSSPSGISYTLYYLPCSPSHLPISLPFVSNILIALHAFGPATIAIVFGLAPDCNSMTTGLVYCPFLALKYGDYSPLERVILIPVRSLNAFCQISSFWILTIWPRIMFESQWEVGHSKSISPLLFGN